MASNLITPCDDGCTLKLDIDQILDVYNKLIIAINTDLDTYYEAGRINGATWADMATTLKSKAIDSAINAVSQLQMKETPMDRAVKQEQIDASQSKTVRDDEVADEQITSSKSKTTRDDEVADEQIDASQIDSTNKTCMANTDCELKQAQKDEISIESGRRDNVTTEQVISSGIKSTNETCVATAECTLKDAQKAKVNFEVSNILPGQENLTKRQIIGFDDNKFIKGFNAGMSGWALAFSSGLMGDETGAGFPSFITDDELSTSYEELMLPTTLP